MIDNIKLVLKSHIQQVKWMNASHKSYAQNKLKNMRIIVGALEEMYDEEEFDELLGLDNVNLNFSRTFFTLNIIVEKI